MNPYGELSMVKKVIMPSISCIVARTRCDSPDRKYRDNVIGCGNTLPWHLKSDLRRFREITTGHALIMGHKTFASMGKPLPNRTNIVLSRRAGTENNVGTSSNDETQLLFAPTYDEALYMADMTSILRGQNEFFVIGGETIFMFFFDLANKVYLTEVLADLPGDAFFESTFSLKTWKPGREVDFSANDDDQYASRFRVYERRKRRYRHRIQHHVLTEDVTTNTWIAEHIAKQRSKIRDYVRAHQAEIDPG